MKKIISALLLCTPLSAMAADATVDLKFTGNLLQPTCSASFVGTSGTDIAFGAINASDIYNKTGDVIISAAPVKDVFLQLDNCGGGVTQMSIAFGGTAVSGYQFYGKAATLSNPKGDSSGVGFALFRDKSKTALADAIPMKDEKVAYNISQFTKTGNTYKLPLYAKMVVVRDAFLTNLTEINNRAAGQDLTANAYVNIEYQ